MTTTYLVHAWCDRPFITYLDPVEADTPEQAIAIARRQRRKLLDAAEECNGKYPWDEFAVYDEEGNELLHILDDDARLEIAAPELLAALKRTEAALHDIIGAADNGEPYSREELIRLFIDDWNAAHDALAEVEPTAWAGEARLKKPMPEVNPITDLPPPFDAYEIHGVRQFGRGKSRHCEQVPDDEAQFWSLYGHIPAQGLECIGDFKSRQLAEEIYARITGKPYANR
jgi:hypothetical protein